MIDAQPGAAIVIGYEWRQRIAVQSAVPVFPAGVVLLSHVRAKTSDTAILATLTIANGGIVVVSETEIDLVIPATATALMKVGSVVLDIARTDQPNPQYLQISLEIPVRQSVTRL